jgi:hypothetical protein
MAHAATISNRNEIEIQVGIAMDEIGLSSPALFLKTVRKFRRLLDQGKITAVEFADDMVRSSAGISEFDDRTITEIAAEIPAIALAPLHRSIARVLAPDYRYVLHFGGPGPTPEVRERMRQAYEARIQSFAAAMSAKLPPD